MSDTITYRELHTQACVRREVHVELHRLVESIGDSRSNFPAEKKLERIRAAMKRRAEEAAELVSLSWNLHLNTRDL